MHITHGVAMPTSLNNETMHAVQLTAFGSVDTLQYTQVPRPRPAANEVRIRVGACGLNNTDLNLRKGWYGADDESGWKEGETDFPIIQGADIVGEVESVGTDVTDLAPGTRVMVNPTIYMTNYDQNPMDIDYIGSERPGGFAEYVCVPASNAYPVDTDLTDAELATFPTAYLTAEHMLERAHITAGETVLVTGASGGVGSALLQLIRVRGAEAVAVVGTGKEQQALDLGATAAVSRHTPDLAAAVQAHTIDAVADMVGGPGFSQLMDIVRPGGRIVTCGAIAGPTVELDLRPLYLRHLSLIGSTLGTASDFAALVDYIEDGKIRPLLAATYPLRQMRAAQTAFEEKSHFGKIVIQP